MNEEKFINIEDIPEGLRVKYIKKCPLCLIENTMLTQHDNDPEYYTEIYLQCQCGNFIEFNLPIN